MVEWLARWTLTRRARVQYPTGVKTQRRDYGMCSDDVSVGCYTYTIAEDHWTIDRAKWPVIEWPDIYNYLIEKP